MVSDATNLAKKLKQSWVQVQKIRSQWKAQKRKEGLPSSCLAIPDGKSKKRFSTATDDNSDQEMTEEERNAGTESVQSDSGDAEKEEMSASEEEAERTPPSHNASSRGKEIPQRGGSVLRDRGRGRGRGGNTHHRDRQEASKDADREPEKPSLRELQNKAYSHCSLHTAKSIRPKTGSHGHNPRGAERGRVTQRGGGRGQPDMRLRMNAMLEKIKRDIV